ncbi:5d277f91-c0ec-4941-9ac8-19ee5e35fb5b-CDS [Sclerotinia trifoliorum]|uniref:5d277f91-c0ec-4941-9ac8-19ee5e35fb5b-CDS n=1 Tax=Sclerotinia trifoliorum TaxID=28548 RepID=A0A8H2VU59_9HELO|nr:5d277f91-c0ec-4941-9ac8-19ee5e35fb5b-CDS [Sclerotinia trifoliorum]
MSITITTTTAPSFLNLPSELRLKIWSNLLPGPRTLPIRYSRVNKSYFTLIPPSILLSISSETRTLFLEHYVLLNLNPSYNSTIYINFSLDTLCFDHEECSAVGDLALDFKNCPQSSLIQRVDIDVHLWEILRLFRFDALSEIKYLHGLRNLTLFMRRYEEEQQCYGEAFERSRLARSRELLAGRMLFEGQTTDREISQCQWYVQMVKWEVEHGEDEWIKGKPSVQMWII